MSAAKFPRKIVRGWEAEARETAENAAKLQASDDVLDRGYAEVFDQDEETPWEAEESDDGATMILHMFDRGISLIFDAGDWHAFKTFIVSEGVCPDCLASTLEALQAAQKAQQ